jgi:predicted HicB family RNase H-like nuclease
MKYKNYEAVIEYSKDDNCFIGHIANISDIIGFHGSSIEELNQCFKEAVDDYLDACTKINKKPAKSFSGKLTLRISSAIHEKLAIKAKTSNQSINALIGKCLENFS